MPLLAALATLTMATSAFAQLGNLSADLVFTPLTPCRIVDTRNAGGTIAAGTTRGFKAWGANFTAQGGSPTNCGIPLSTNVAALELNLVVVGTLADGYITAFPFGVAQPNASTLNYFAGAVLANGATVKVSQTSQAFDWNLYTLATTHFVADVTGYYAKPVKTALECTVVYGADTIVAAGSTGTNAVSSSCPANSFYTASYCYTLSFETILAGFNRTSCNFKNPSGSAHTVRHDINCCSVPGR